MRVALGYANRAELAQSNLGFRITEAYLAARPGLRVERFSLSSHLPAASGAELRTEPSRLKLSAVDLILLSLSFEGDAPHLPGMLAAGGLPPLAADRGSGHPLVVAGGAAVMINPEPWAAFCDLFLVGEAEALLEGFFERWTELRGAGRGEQLLGLSRLPGALAPLLRRHRLWGAPGLGPGEEASLRRGDLAGAGPEAPAETAVETVKWTGAAGEVSAARLPAAAAFPEALLIELARGCPRRCRFCVATRIYAPLRQRPAALLAQSALAGSQPGETVGLLSLSAGDHPGLGALAAELCAAGRRVTVSSLPATFAREEAVRAILASGTRTLTLAPETGSDRLRALAGKPLRNEAILEGVELLGRCGVPQLRAYFMIGLPFEEQEDLRALAALLGAMRVRLPAATHLTATINAFTPKPRTPFQWAPMAPAAYLEQAARRIVRDSPRGVPVRIKSLREARLHAALARGDARWGERMAAAARESRPLGQLLRAEGVRLEEMTGAVDPGTPLPWGYLTSPEEAAELQGEWQRAREEATGGSTRASGEAGASGPRR